MSYIENWDLHLSIGVIRCHSRRWVLRGPKKVNGEIVSIKDLWNGKVTAAVKAAGEQHSRGVERINNASGVRQVPEGRRSDTDRQRAG